MNHVDEDCEDNSDQLRIFVAKMNGSFLWFNSDPELWVLDRHKWSDDFKQAGHTVPEDDASDRFGIPVVDKKTACAFFAEMRPYNTCITTLRKELAERFPAARSTWDVADLFPIMFVDFDRQHVCAFYSDGIRLERYVPNGWTSEFEDFLTRYPEDRFPRSQKYWILDNVDIIQELNRRGEKSD